MTDTKVDGEVVIITSEYHLTADHHEQIAKFVSKSIAEGRPVVLDKGLDLQVRRVLPTILKSEHYARVNELLETTNRYQARYRAAEAKLRELGLAQ